MATQSLVLEYPAANPNDARRHFASRLSVETDPSDVYADMQSGKPQFVLIDPRSRSAYDDAHIVGAISLPHREINEHTTARLSKDTLVVVYCWGPACNAGTKAGLKFAQLGFPVKEMIGGFEYWVREGMPIEGSKTEEPDLYGALA